MQKRSKYYGRLGRILACGVVSLCVLSFMHTMPGANWKLVLLPTFLFTVVLYTLWALTRRISRYFDRRFPWEQGLLERSLWQLAWLLVFVVLFAGVPYLLFRQYYPLDNLSDSRASYINGFAIFGCALVVLFGLLINAFHLLTYFLGQWRQSALEAEQLKRATLKAQLDAIKSQLDPHFLFNNFNTLYGLIQEAPAQAGEFLLQLSDIYRYILQNREQEAVPLEEEIRVAKAYLFLLQNRYEEGLQVHWQLRPLAEAYQLPPLTLQMLLENAIKHNRLELDAPLHLHISIKDGYLEVQNTLQRRASVASTQLGLQQLRQRYAFLTQQEVQVRQTSETFAVRVPLLTLAPQPA